MSIKQVGVGVLNPGTVDEAWGLCDDLEIGQEADNESVKDGNGDTVGKLYTDIRKKVSGNYTPKASAEAGSPPTEDDLIGQTIAITLHGSGNTINVVVEDATMKYKRGGVPTFSITGYYYPHMTTSAASAAPAASGSGN